MENYLPVFLIVAALIFSLVAVRFKNNLFLNIVYIALAIFVIVVLLIDFPNHNKFFGAALMGLMLYALVGSALRIRKIYCDKREF